MFINSTRLNDRGTMFTFKIQKSPVSSLCHSSTNVDPFSFFAKEQLKKSSILYKSVCQFLLKGQTLHVEYCRSRLMSGMGPSESFISEGEGEAGCQLCNI